MSSAPPSDPSRQETVTWTVFQKDLAPRSFQITLQQIERAGWLLGSLIAALILTSALTLRYFNLSRRTQDGIAPALPALEEQAAERERLEKEVETLKSELATARKSIPAPAESPPSQASTPSPAVPAPITGSLFSALPANYPSTPVPRENLPIELTAPQWTFKDRALGIKFAIQYTRGDNGTQQGRIILLARSGSRILAYPEGVLQNASAAHLLEPGQGEYFSVQRYREVIAEFGPLPSREEIKEVHVILLSTDGKILLSDRLIPQWTTAGITPPRKRPEKKTRGPKSPSERGNSSSSNEPSIESSIER
jgi:hypothetical protein